tara:strand:- start:369 stop:569 length:201 start_codon:yes stop_codon:yes gene_type:complete
MFDLDKELKKIKKMQKVELKKRKKDVFTRSSLDDALSVALLKLALKDDQESKEANKDDRHEENNNS